MKKYLLALVVVVLQTGITFSQEGYSWTFGTVPPPSPPTGTYSSTPAMTGSTGTHPLSVIDYTLPAVSPASEVIPLGSCPATPIAVSRYGGAVNGFNLFGLQFDNAPQYVGNVYTIELTGRFDPTFDYHRLIGFNDINIPGNPGTTSDDGIYIDPDFPVGNGEILFRVGGVDTYIGPHNIAPDTWYHITLVRDATNQISFYLNGVYIAAYDDSALDFVPKPANGNKIVFFRDELNGTEDVGGYVAKISIYNRTLTVAEIERRTSQNVCNTTVVLAAEPNEGHQWRFPNGSADPFASTPAVGGSVGPFSLFAMGGSPITTFTSEVIGLGASCTAPSPVGLYPLDAGLEFQNTPRYIYDTYTIELAINFDALGGTSKKLFSFEDLSLLPQATYGVYVEPGGNISFYNGVDNIVGAAPLTTGVWYHLVFVRASTGIISYYRNGVLIGTYTDAAGDFIPKSATGNFITFLKDDDGAEETSGKIAKIGIFNAVLPDYDVVERFNSICNDALVILPVNLTSFTATRSDDKVQLKWVTASEQNNMGFEVQRSSDGSNFTGIGFVNGNGTTNQENTYYFTDQSPQTGKNYYRLKQVDIDNRVTYSGIRSIEIGVANRGIQLFPNPSHSLITVTNIKAGDQMSIFNTQGNLVMRKRANNGQEIISIGTLPSGVYLLQVTDNENNKKTIRFTKF